MVNGAEKPLRIVNGVFRGLEIPAGESEVIMNYRPLDFTWSATISLGALAFIIALASLKTKN